MMKRLSTLFLSILCASAAFSQTRIAGALPSYNDAQHGQERQQQYWPIDGGFECVNGTNRFTRALYGGHTDYRIETSDRPVFAVVKKGHHRHLRFVVNGVPLDSTDYCRALYKDGMRYYVLKDRRWQKYGSGLLRLRVVALQEEEGAVFQFVANDTPRPLDVQARLCDIANPKLKRNGDIGADAPGVFEAAPGEQGLEVSRAETLGNGIYAHVVVKLDKIVKMLDMEAFDLFNRTVAFNQQLASRIEFHTPDPYINTLGGALIMAANGDWDGQTWLHGCIGWRMPLAGWRAAYAGDALGWGDRAKKHFDSYAKSQVTQVEPTIKHPSQDAKMNMARAEKKWGTQMYSNGYICRNPERNDQMHHYDMNLNYMDELLWHFQYDADQDYMRTMWPVIQRHLAWEKRNFDPDGDHLYDAYCCIWASDALYYSGGAVTHSSAYNYRGNLLAARIAELIGKDPKPYQQEAEAILEAMNQRLWMKDKKVWAEYQDAMGLRRLHDHPAVWSIYTPIDCQACSPQQAWEAIDYMDSYIPHIATERPHKWHWDKSIDYTAEELNIYAQAANRKQLRTISTTDWMPYSWSINNVATAEVMHMALACFQAGRATEGYELLMANIMDNMYYGQSPANFGQLSHFDAARGECYRDFGDCIGIASRTLLQGLFGVVPQALYGRCLLTPGFPDSWKKASLKTPYIEYRYTREGNQDRYEITQHFAQPLKMVVRQHLGAGRYRETEGNDKPHQVITVEHVTPARTAPQAKPRRPAATQHWGTDEPKSLRDFKPKDLTPYFNASVTDIFKNKYLKPRPKTTTLQIPVQGVGEWCHPEYTPTIDDSGLRKLARKGKVSVGGITFRTPAKGQNIIFTSLWDNYPDSIQIPLKGRASSAWLLMAGTTNHMQSHIDNGMVTVTYTDGTTSRLPLRNPDNWCPIEQDYFVDGHAFRTTTPRPYRICLANGTVSRDLGFQLNIKGVYGREIPGGAAQMLRVPLHSQKTLQSLTVRTLSNDVVIGLMAVTLQ